MSIVRPMMGGQGGGGQGSQLQPGGSAGGFGHVDQPSTAQQLMQGMGQTSQGQGLQTQKQGLQGQEQGQQCDDYSRGYQGASGSSGTQDDQGLYTQRGGWTPGQFSQMNLQGQGQTQGQGRQQGQQSQGQTQEYQQQGAVYRGDEWKTMEHEEEPLIVHAPSGPMPGKPRNQPQNRSSEERERARRFGFPPTRLLVLSDGSDNAHRALEAALHFRRRNDSLFVVNAVQLMDDTVEYDQTNRLLKDKGRKIIDEVTKLIHEREIGRWECACLPSRNAKEAVLDYAQKHNIELIFIGSRGIDAKTGDFYPGSFSKYVINNSHCSVMLVR